MCYENNVTHFLILTQEKAKKMTFDVDKYRKHKNTRVTAAKKDLEKKSYIDNRFWKPKFSKEGTTKNLIRFIPSKVSNKNFIEYYSHFVKGETKDENGNAKMTFFSCDCPKKMLNKKCAICDAVSDIYNKPLPPYVEANNVCKGNSLFVGTAFITNILVIDDEANPENNGKVFLYKMPKSVKEIVASTPEVLANDAFDIVDGKNFVLEAHKEAAYDYSKSSFVDQRTGIDGEERNPSVIQAIYDKTYGFDEWFDEKKYLDYDFVKGRLSEIISVIKFQQEAEGYTPKHTKQQTQKSTEQTTTETKVETQQAQVEETTKVETQKEETSQPNWTDDDDEIPMF